MINAKRYLKPVWLRQQFELARALLPVGSRMELHLGGKLLAKINEADHDLSEGMPGVQAFPLILEGEQVGALLLSLPAAGEIAQAEIWGKFLAYTLQGMLESEHGHRSVTRETLESYREVALLQRAASELNRSLEPTEVAAALLKEFDVRKAGADFGAVFLRNADGVLELIQSFGIAASDTFGKLADGEFFANIAEREYGDYVNALTLAQLWKGEVPEFESLLWQPLSAHGEHLGLLVLALQCGGGFTAADLQRSQTLCSVAVTALRNARLYAAEQKMFQSFVSVIATAIDAKSSYTAGHCRRVPEISLMIAEAAHKTKFADFVLNDDERKTIEIAGMLHDCGKVVTPEWVVDKATKLDSIENRIHLVALRFEVLRRDALIAHYCAQTAGEPQESADAVYRERLRQLDDDFAFLEKCNTGSEFVSGEHIARIENIARQCWSDARGETHPLLTENEVYNLSIQRGTLNQEERKIIEEHATHTISMLSQIEFPRSLRNVTDYAAGHHERMDGKGYPRGLKREQLSIPARMVAIADIFEALTAPDRPYRKPGKLSWAIDIMHRMKLDNHIDGDLFNLFLSEKVYLGYARKHLSASQIDDIDISRYLAQEGS